MVTMDTCHRYCHWILYTGLLLFLHQCLQVSGSARICPQGQLMHRHKSEYVTCCYPTRCGVGEQVVPCSVNGTGDRCQECGNFKNQSLRTSSFRMNQCTYWPLDKNCKNVNNPDRPWDITDERTKRCICNIEQGKWLNPPESVIPGVPMDSYCQRTLEHCQPGHEPDLSGGCRPCMDNYFKSVIGYGLCEPKTDCALLGLEFISHSDATADNNCSEPELVVTVKPATHSTHSTVTPGDDLTDDNLHDNTSKESSSNMDIVWIILGCLMFVIIIVILIILRYCWIRQRKIRRVARTFADPGGDHVDVAILEERVHFIEHISINGNIIPQPYMNGKTIANGISFDTEELLNSQTNGNISNGHFPTGNGSVNSHQYINPLHAFAASTPRPGILKSANKNVVFAQRQNNNRDLSLDVLDDEKLQVRIDGYGSDPDLGEVDCLVIADNAHGISSDQIRAGIIPRPSGVIQTGVPVLALNGCGRRNFGQIYLENGQFLPFVQPSGPAVAYAPANNAVTFTRSGSLIASPEGEIDQEELEARFPRFSQLLQESMDNSVSDSATDSNRSNSADHQQGCQGNPPHQQHCQGNAANQSAAPPAVVEPVQQQDPPADQPDHRIMDLKELELEGSMNPSFNSVHSDTRLKTTIDLRPTTHPGEVECDDAQQTVQKTFRSPTVDNSVTEKTFFDDIVHIDDEEISDNLAKRKRLLPGAAGQIMKDKANIKTQNNIHNKFDQKLAPYQGSTSNGQCGVEPARNANLRTLVRTSSSKTNIDDNNKGAAENSFKEDNLPATKQQVSQLARSENPPNKDTVFSRGPLRTVSDPERASSSDIDEAGKKDVVDKGSAREDGQKGTGDDVDASPNKSAVYRRSQSHNAPSSSELAHKPPPRSNSEEKPQKLERPVAKVKPMPPSDTSVNQLPLEDIDGNTLETPDVNVPDVARNNSTAIMHDSDSDESDDESEPDRT